MWAARTRARSKSEPGEVGPIRAAPTATGLQRNGLPRGKRHGGQVFVLGVCITAASWFSSSTSFANPATTIGRTLSDTSAGIAPSSVPMFVPRQLFGAVLAVGAVSALYPDVRAAAADVTHLDHAVRQETR